MACLHRMKEGTDIHQMSEKKTSPIWKLNDVSFLSRIPLPYASHSVFVGSELGYYKLWSEEFGFSVTIDSATNVAVTLTKNHNNRTCGLCGNFNSVQADDYTAQEGTGAIAGNRLESEVWNCVCQLTVSSRKIRKVAPLVEFRKWLMSWLGSNRKKWQLWTGRDKIETKKGKHCWWVRWGRPLPISLCIYMGVVSGFLTEHSYDFANSWAVSGPLTVCQRVSKPSKYCNGTKPTTEVRVQETQNTRVVRKCERLECKLWRYLAERKKKNNIYLYRYIVKYIYIYLHIVIFRL